MKKKKVITIIVLAAVIVFMVACYFSFDPTVEKFFPQCIFKAVTGYDCPGCGIQRAFHALLHGDVKAAFHYNAFLVVSVPLMCLYGYGELRREKHPRLYSFLNSPYIIVGIGIMTVGWWIFRNL